MCGFRSCCWDEGVFRSNRAVGNPAVGNRVYTNDVRLRGRRGYSEIQNHRVKSSTRGGGFCLCSRGFNRRVFWFFGLMADRIFGWMCDRVLLFRDSIWIDRHNSFASVASKIIHIECQNMCCTICFHNSHKTSIMYLNSRNSVSNN